MFCLDEECRPIRGLEDARCHELHWLAPMARGVLPPPGAEIPTRKLGTPIDRCNTRARRPQESAGLTLETACSYSRFRHSIWPPEPIATTREASHDADSVRAPDD